MAGKSSGVGVGGYLSAEETARQGDCDSGRAQAVARLGEMLCEQAAARLHGGGGAPCHRRGSGQKQWQQQLGVRRKRDGEAGRIRPRGGVRGSA
jgi:hypothetical protein